MSEHGPDVTLLRHGETEWSASGRHTGRTEIDLTPRGEDQAKATAGLLGPEPFDLVLVSPRRRARHTAELVGFGDYEVVDDLAEWDYGDFEGLTSAQIQRQIPGWEIWTGPWPGGETAADVAARADRVVRRLLEVGRGRRVALVAHGHILRALAARWIEEEVTAGRRLGLDTASVSELGWEHAYRVLHRWNQTPP